MTALLRTCPRCRRVDDTARHVYGDDRGVIGAYHRECCGCRDCRIELLRPKART